MENNIKVEIKLMLLEGLDWTNLAEDSEKWQALIYMVGWGIY